MENEMKRNMEEKMERNMEEKMEQNSEVRPFVIPEMDSACDLFCQRLSRTVREQFVEVMHQEEGRPSGGYFRALMLSQRIQNIFVNQLGSVPQEVQLACKLSEMIVAPDTMERARLLRTAVGCAGCAVGIGMILGAIGSVLGWGTGALAAVKAWLIGSPMFGPIAMMASGACIAAIATYWVYSGTEAEHQQKFCEALDRSLQEAVRAIWGRCGAQLQAAE